TEIDAPAIENCGTTASVTPVDVPLPVPAAVNGVAYLERFEGMLVRFHQTLYVTEHFQLGQFGQIVMSSGGRLQQPTSIVPPGSPNVNGRLKVVGMNVLNYFLTLDDGTSRCGPIGSKQQCRGAETAQELSRQQAKLNQALIKMDADIIGMSELENAQDVQGVD